MRAAGAAVEAPADDLAAAHDHGAYGGIRAGRSGTAPRQSQRFGHVAEIGRGNSSAAAPVPGRALPFLRFFAGSSRLVWIKSFRSRMNSLTSSKDR